MAYINFQNCTKQEYDQTLYSQDAKNKIKIYFNNIELENSDLYCEKLTRIFRILPDDSSKRFSLDNFISQELTLILHDVDEEVIKDDVRISIGTLVNNEYEYVPLGIFNIQDTPTTDKNKITIKLRDNRIKFDFGYNAKPLIDMYGGVATKRQILNDICEKSGIICDIPTFRGENEPVAIYDNSITATTYISYLAEQSGNIAVIDRDGILKFISLTDLYVHRIPLSIVEKYEIGNKFTIERMVFEDGITKFQTSQDESLDTLYLNSANPYISSQEQIQEIFNSISGFEIDSINTGKILGNPSIDAYDIIEIYDDYDEQEPIIARTLANGTFTYNGVCTVQYKTEIGLEERKNNVTINGEATYRRYAKAEYDNVNASINLMAGEITDQNNKLAQMQVTVDEINAKISDIADVTVSAEDTDAQVELENINESEPIQIKIRPIGVNIGYDYPHNDYPQNDYSKIRTLMFTRTYTEEGVTKTQEIPYPLPDDLLYYDEETFDEFYLDYDSETCQITKRCEYGNDGSVIPLANEQIVPYEYPLINLGSGNYTVCLLGYNTAYIMVRLMVSNIYTTQFATKVEMHSAISLTAEEINAEVGRKVGDNEVIAKINLTPETATIQANKINIAGTITAINNNTSTTINGNKITTGSITATQIASNAITADKIQAGAITASKVSSDIITTSNFSAQNINADKITAGSLSMSRIAGGTLNVGANGGYLRVGIGYTHPEVSGLNVTGSGGISMNGHGIGGCASIGVNTIGTYSTGEVYINTATRINGAVYYLGWDGNYHQLAGLYSWYQSGITGQSGFKDSNNNNIYLAFSDGLLVGASRSAWSTSQYPWLA